MRPRPATVLALGPIVAAFVALGGLAATNALVYYVTPTELSTRPTESTVRLYGLVVPGTTRFDESAAALTFQVTDGSTSIAVRSTSLPTSLFSDGIGVVLVGRLTGPGAFEAQEILIKHSEVYEPLRPGETIPPGVLERLRGGG